MPVIESRLKSSSTLDTNNSLSHRPDRKSADAVFLSASTQTPELSRVNSTPLCSDGLEALTLQTSTSSGADDPLQDPTILTIAPPKPGPADTLYPSPSGGFVPSPEEGQDWRLKPPPPGRNTRGAIDPSTAVSSSSMPIDLGSSTAKASPRSSASAPTRPPSLPSSQETASKIAVASSNSLSRRSSQISNSFASPQLRSMSNSDTSSRHRLSTASSLGTGLPASSSSQTLSPSLTSPHQKRASGTSNRSRLSQDEAKSGRSSRAQSTSSYQTAKVADDASSPSVNLPPVRIRDFAFPNDDPRYHGERIPDTDEHVRPRSSEGYVEEGEEEEFYVEEAEDEEEFGGDEGDAGHMADGVYKVLYQFDPESEHELAVQPGDVVRVVGSIEGGWSIAVKGEDAGVKGLVPATYLEWLSPLSQ